MKLFNQIRSLIASAFFVSSFAHAGHRLQDGKRREGLLKPLPAVIPTGNGILIDIYNTSVAVSATLAAFNAWVTNALCCDTKPGIPRKFQLVPLQVQAPRPFTWHVCSA